VDDNTAEVAILTTFIVFGLPIGAFVLFRVLKHRERMAAIRYGTPPPDRGWESSFAMSPPVAGPAPDALAVRAQFRKGVVLAFIGMALTLGLSSGFQHFGPAVLGGLIPLFIGLAQITLAIFSDPTLLRPFTRAERSGWTGPVPPSGSRPSPPPFDGVPYTYRPDQTQELRPPVERKPGG